MELYKVIDKTTKQQMGKLHSTMKAARASRERLDLKYGCYQYMVVKAESVA